MGKGREDSEAIDDLTRKTLATQFVLGYVENSLPERVEIDSFVTELKE